MSTTHDGFLFIQDLKLVPIKLYDEFIMMNSLYDEFKKGSFVVNTRCNSFSKITMDQAQEHNNKKIKSISGYINLVNQEDKKVLEKIEFAGQKFISTWDLLRVVHWPKVTTKKLRRLLHHSTKIISRFMKIF